MEEIIYIIDRIEGDYAVCISEDENDTMDIPTVLVPECAEGSCISVTLKDDDGVLEIVEIKKIERDSIKEENQSRLNKLFNK
ncbi:MAG: DUF3006 domain-containing protein [Clostridia bacterium]|nr:DUF3006 domain-containing protein [Clostridia bacterium]